MDALSKVLELARIKGSLDLRCQLAGSFALDHEPLALGEAPFHLVLSGKANLELRDGTYIELTEGDFVLLPRGSAHVVSGVGHTPSSPIRVDDDGPIAVRRNTGSDEVELDLLCGRFTYAPGAADLIMSALPEILHISLAEEGKPEALDGVVSLLRDEVVNLQSGALAIVTALSTVLFALALRAHARRDGMPASLLVLLTDARLSQAVLAMTKEPEKHWTLDMLAKQANMSRATFARHIANKGNLSPMDLLTSIRMQIACEMLESSSFPVGAVAERVGYQSESAFTKAFQRKLGFTPASYRRHSNRRSR
jgi:AraC family transcriptional regulator, activator of mtrCDE